MIVYKMTSGSVITQERATHKGGRLQVQATGEFNGATLDMQVSQDGQGFITLGDYAQTAPSTLLININSGAIYRFIVSGEVGTTNITVSVLG